jgi:alkylation response protein AidB-like acyl-CoA dehydrogenase
MGFMPDENVEELRGYLRSFLDKEASEARLRQQLGANAGYDAELWHRAASELGLQGMAVPEAHGGGGFGLTELGVVFEELGRALACAPFFSTLALAVPALTRACSADDAAALLGAIATGSRTVTATWTDGHPSQTSIIAVDGALTGVAPVVVDGNDADEILVAARDVDGTVGLYAVDQNSTGWTASPLVALDTTRRLSRVAFDSAPARRLGADVGPALDAAAQVAGLLLGAEQLGVATKLLETAVEYAKTRVQFGRHIGSFQAIKHRCADMLVDVELARSLIYHALDAAQHDESALALESALARGFLSDVAVRVAGASLQIHGGIGFTWEHSTHLYLKRAKSAQLLMGRPDAHRAHAAQLLGIAAGAR